MVLVERLAGFVPQPARTSEAAEPNTLKTRLVRVPFADRAAALAGTVVELAASPVPGVELETLLVRVLFAGLLVWLAASPVPEVELKSGSVRWACSVCGCGAVVAVPAS